MHRNLTQPPYRDVIERPLPFQTGKRSLDGCPLPKQGLPCLGILPYAEPFDQLLVTLVHLNDWLCPILAAYQSKQVFARVTSVGHDKAWVKAGSGFSGLLQHIGGPSYIAYVASAHMRPNGQFCFAVHQQVQLPAIGALFDALRTSLNRPSRLWVCLGILAPVAPSLQRRAVQSYPLPEPGGIRVAASYQSARHILDLRSHVILSKPSKEAAEGGLVGDSIGPWDAASLSNPRIVGQGANQGIGRGKAKVVLRNEAAPERVGRVSFRASAGGACKGLKKGRVVKIGKEPLKLLDDGRRLYRCARGGKLSRNHGMLTPSCWSGAVGVDAPAAPSFCDTVSLLRNRISINSYARIIATNYKSVQTKTRHTVKVVGGENCVSHAIRYVIRLAPFTDALGWRPPVATNLYGLRPWFAFPFRTANYSSHRFLLSSPPTTTTIMRLTAVTVRLYSANAPRNTSLRCSPVGGRSAKLAPDGTFIGSRANKKPAILERAYLDKSFSKSYAYDVQSRRITRSFRRPRPARRGLPLFYWTYCVGRALGLSRIFHNTLGRLGYFPPSIDEFLKLKLHLQLNKWL